jgi:hypothetical protein
MGYRDEFIQRMKDMGVWECWSDEERQEYGQISDEKAGRIIADFDWLAMGDAETTKRVGMLAIKEALRGFLGVFGGKLLELRGENAGGLSRAGILLAEFIQELEEQGIHWGTIAEEFPKLNNLLLIMGIRQMYSRRNEENEEN